MIEEMEWFQQHGHEVWLAAAEGSGIQNAAVSRGLNFMPLRFRGSINPKTIAKLFSAARSHRVDLIVSHSSRDTFAAWPVARMLRVPLVRYQHICVTLKDSFMHRMAWQRAATRIVAVSESIKKRLLKQKLSKPDAIEVIGEYVDLSMFHPGVESGDVRSILGIPADATLITQIGMIRPDKGQQILVQAADAILQKHPKCWFMFVGSATEPRYLEELHAAVASIRNPGRIIFAGFQNDLAPFIAATDIICLTSLLEAQSKVIPQAFAMNKLVVASRVGGIPELVQHGESGLLYKKGDAHALAEAVDAAFSCERDKLIASAYEVAQKMDINRVMERTEKFYESLIA